MLPFHFLKLIQLEGNSTQALTGIYLLEVESEAPSDNLQTLIQTLFLSFYLVIENTSMICVLVVLPSIIYLTCAVFLVRWRAFSVISLFLASVLVKCNSTFDSELLFLLLVLLDRRTLSNSIKERKSKRNILLFALVLRSCRVAHFILIIFLFPGLNSVVVVAFLENHIKKSRLEGQVMD